MKNIDSNKNKVECNFRKCFCYVRSATVEQSGQNKRRFGSLHNQEKECRKYAEKDGLKITKVFSDEGVNGLEYNKPAFNQMISECKKQKVSHVVVSGIDRLARDYVLCLWIMDLLKKNKIEIHSVDVNSFNHEGGEKNMKSSATPEVTLMTGIFSIFKEHEKKIRSERIKRGLLRRKMLLAIQ